MSMVTPGEINDDGYELLGELCDSGCWGYEWDQTELWRKDGKLFVRYGSGCSCNSIEDEDYEEVTYFDQVKAIIENRSYDPTEKSEFLSLFNKALQAQ